MAKSKKLAGYVHVNGQVYGPADDVPKDVADQITNPKAWADGSDESTDDRPKPIADMNAAELKAELATRNAQRAEADQIVPESGSKAHLLAALQADDAARV